VKPQILVLERIDRAGLEALSEFADVIEFYGASRAAASSAAARVDAVVVKSQTLVDGNFLDVASRLCVVARAGVGTENISLTECAARNIRVITTPTGNTVATAELTIALMLALCRNLPQLLVAVEKRDFRRHLFEGRELSCLRVGLLGMGNVALATAERLRGFGVEIAAWSPSRRRHAEFEKVGVKVFDSIDSLLRWSELLSLHACLNSESRHVLNSRRLRQLPRGSLLVNTARGGLVDDGALLSALDENHIAAAAIDVLDPEPPFHRMPPASYTHPLLGHSRVMVTPHVGAATRESQRRIALEIAFMLREQFDVAE
jgi:D-3-phosphoglycerate dehydrogenase